MYDAMRPTEFWFEEDGMLVVGCPGNWCANIDGLIYDLQFRIHFAVLINIAKLADYKIPPKEIREYEFMKQLRDAMWQENKIQLSH